MCLDCGCGAAHDNMGQPDIHITYEDLKRAAEENGQTVRETLDTIVKTAEKDKAAHPAEY